MTQVESHTIPQNVPGLVKVALLKYGDIQIFLKIRRKEFFENHLEHRN